VGNCWFMAAASAVAEIPGRLEKSFVRPEDFDNQAGFFDVKLFILGVPITIRVDDYLPFWGTYT